MGPLCPLRFFSTLRYPAQRKVTVLLLAPGGGTRRDFSAILGHEP